MMMHHLWINFFSRIGANKTGDDLPPLVVGYSNHSNFRDQGMFQKHIFNLCGKQVFAPADDHFFYPPGDAYIAARVHRAQITGVQTFC